MKVRVEMKPVNQIVKRLGLDPGGRAQRFHTLNVRNRIQKYMPFRTGMTIKVMMFQTDGNSPEVVLDVPYAKFLYYGKLMVDPVTGAAGFRDKDGQWKSWTKRPKVQSNRPITYTTTKNPQAGPYWDRRLAAAEGDVMAQELEDYIRNGGTV